MTETPDKNPPRETFMDRITRPEPDEVSQAHALPNDDVPDDRISLDVLYDRLEATRAVLKTYLMTKIEAEDWHGVCDAANDLRDVDAQLEILDLVL